MTNWKSLLNNDATDWLLDETNPSVRYFALRWLLDKPHNDPEVVHAQQAIAQSTAIQQLMARQRPEGYWGSDARPHIGTRGPMMVFLWLGAPKNPAIEKAMEYRIAGCLLENGAYGMRLKGHTVYLPCHGAEFLTLMLRYGYAHDPRTRQLLDWLIRVQQADGVWSCLSKVKPFPCMWATADVLRAFGELPVKWLTAPVRAARARAVDLFLNSRLSAYGKRKADPSWFQFGFPLQFTSDVLDVLESVAPFVAPTEPRIQEALNLVLAKQDKHGCWACDKQPKGGMWIEKYVKLETIGEPSKWVTLHVYKMLKTLYANA